MPKKGENIYKRADGRWEGRYIKTHAADGKAKYGYVYAKTYREVKSKLIDAIAKCGTTQAKMASSKNADLFSVVAYEWLDSLRPKVKESTINKYHNLLESYVSPQFSEMRLQKITHEFIENHCNELLKNGGTRHKGLSTKTVSDTLSVIRRVLKYASDSGRDTLNDGRSVKVKHSSKEIKVFSRSEQERLLSYLYQNPTSINTGIMLCLFTGMRVGEICALHWEDISLSEQTVYVHQTMQRIQNKNTTVPKTRIVVTTPKSSCSIRIIPLPKAVSTYIAKYCPPATGFFLTNSNHNLEPCRIISNVLSRNADSKKNYHILRHTFATRCVELGFDVKTLSEILGHASVNITMNRYVHPTLELKKENMQRLEELFAVK